MKYLKKIFLGKINKIPIDFNDSSTNGNSLDLKESVFQVIKDLRDRDSVQSKLTKTGFDSIDDKLVEISPVQLIICCQAIHG